MTLATRAKDPRLDYSESLKVKSGELTGFYIGGSAVQTPDTVAA